MQFDDFPLTDAEGAILAHSVRAGRLILKKGRQLDVDDIAALRAADIATVTAARLEAGDIHEDEAATRLAKALAGPGIDCAAAATGRVNLFADTAGVLVVDKDRLDRLNRLDEALTVATLPAFAPVEPGQMAATVKIIPFAAPADALLRSEAIGAEGGPTLAIAAFRPRPVTLIQTRLPGVKERVLDKTARITADRLTALGCRSMRERRCPHDRTALAREIAAALQTSEAADPGLILIVGASAITDRRDILPTAVEQAGGQIVHFGMPVDPGNLLLLASIGDIPVLGLPGCARSPKLNGFDWLLQRLVADLPVSRQDIMAMGVGGLLMEIPSRPAPRVEPAGKRQAIGPEKQVAAIVLAAGRSSRMGPRNKMTTPVDGVPMVVRAVDTALASRAEPVIVVTGHDQEAVEDLVAGRPVTVVYNADYAKGLSTSLKTGLAALPDVAEGALVCLADMPRVSPAMLDRLIDAFDPDQSRAIVVPTWAGRRGNPVLWGRRFFGEMRRLAGDVGAKHLIGEHDAVVAEIEMPDDGILIDVDTPAALADLLPEQTD